jgi:hypothetical protein
MVATLPATIHGSQARITLYESNVDPGNPPRYSGGDYANTKWCTLKY